MKMFFMRHGEAEHFADADAARQLTPRGRVESEAVARACKEQGFAQFDKVLVSPYIRAQQTWQEISEYFLVVKHAVVDVWSRRGEIAEISELEYRRLARHRGD